MSPPFEFVISGKETSLERPCPIYSPDIRPHRRQFGGKWIVHSFQRAPNSPQLVPSRGDSSWSEKDTPQVRLPNLIVECCVSSPKIDERWVAYLSQRAPSSSQLILHGNERDFCFATAQSIIPVKELRSIVFYKPKVKACDNLGNL